MSKRLTEYDPPAHGLRRLQECLDHTERRTLFSLRNVALVSAVAGLFGGVLARTLQSPKLQVAPSAASYALGLVGHVDDSGPCLNSSLPVFSLSNSNAVTVLAVVGRSESQIDGSGR
jgi:hypothetical protein